MRLFGFCATLLLVVPCVWAAAPPSPLWTELKAKREGAKGFHQEFDVTQTFRSSSGSRAFKRQLILDVAGGKWRERMVGGSGNRITIFNGAETLSTEEGSGEYQRTKRPSKTEDPEPWPYGLGDPDWTKAKELRRQRCGFEKDDHECVVIEVPLKQKMRAESGSETATMVQGGARVAFDTQTGLLISSRTVQSYEREGGSYEADTLYLAKAIRYGVPDAAGLFALPAEATREVKEFSHWNAAKIKKQLAGKPAPELSVTDMNGNPVTLAAFKGKTVLLDFWTTWCPPCRADAPGLDKLYRQYGEKQLAIVGISVSEDRQIVTKFLAEHRHDYQIVLTSENEMPRPYQIGVFPTYIVIDPDGSLEAAVEGDQGFAELRKLLKKAGLESE